MKISNHEEFEKECKKRGWDARAYQHEIEEALNNRGGCDEDLNYYGEYYDCFFLEEPTYVIYEKNGIEVKKEFSSVSPEELDSYDCDFTEPTYRFKG